MIEEFVLPADVSIVAVSGLDPALRDRLDCGPDDYAVTRHGARSTSSVVDRLTARLLERFRSPLTIVDAVIALSRAERLDPRQTLEDSFEVLARFVADGMLVAAGSPRAEAIRATLRAGDRVGDLTVVEPVHVVVDTEVYRARTDADEVALKIARPGSERAMAAVFAHEASVLRLLDGQVDPGLVADGEHDGRPYLAVFWHPGVDVLDAAAELRALDDPSALLALVERVLSAFAHLHRQSVVHGDVHPRNILIDADSAVTVIDFGLSAAPGAPALLAGGVDLFMAPEVAAARLDGVPETGPAVLREQYSLAALAFAALTGSHTHDFSLHRDEMLRQVRDDPPVPFARVHAGAPAAVEPVIGRALAKKPGDRFASVDEFLGEFRRARGPLRPERRVAPAARRLVDRVLARLAVPGELFPDRLPAPTASVMNGAAGFAYALLRMAAVRDDERLLGLADLWSAAAVRQAGSEIAFFNADLDLMPGVIGQRSFYHHAPGVHAVQVLISAARADDVALAIALDAFLRTAGEPCPALDVAFGRAGLLIACAQLVEAMPATVDTAALRALGNRLSDDIDAELAGEPAIAESARLTQIGAAHGWAGHLFALLRWSAATGRTPAPAIPERLVQLARLGQAQGRAMRWPMDTRARVIASPLTASWCNGSAGLVPLWVLADTVYGDHGRLAAAAAWGAYETTDGAGGDLCCGLAGRAYALIAMHHHSGDPVWLARARRLAEAAAERVRAESFRRDSLYKGEVGVALLIEEVTTASPAGLPLFGPEGWPPPAGPAKEPG